MNTCKLTGLKCSTVAGGRIAVHVPGHPAANNRGYIQRARYIMEQHLGRLLESNEHVHHKDDNKFNDSLNNLEVLDIIEHAILHNNLGGEHGGSKRVVDYEVVAKYMLLGYGYKKIAKITGYNVNTVKSACRVMRGKRP